jgi:transposase
MIKAIGLNIAKNVLQVHGIDETGQPALRRKLRRAEVLRLFYHPEPALVGIEACHTAHPWASEIAALGHEVRLMPPQFVRPYVKSQKNDAADAEAICEAVQRPTMRFVLVKGADQQAVLLLHRTRDLLIRQRSSLISAIRAHFAEFGGRGPEDAQHRPAARAACRRRDGVAGVRRRAAQPAAVRKGDLSAVMGEDRPGDLGERVGQGNGCDIAMGALEQTFEPATERRIASGDAL